jgi:hypothetical protein
MRTTDDPGLMTDNEKEELRQEQLSILKGKAARFDRIVEVLLSNGPLSEWAHVTSATCDTTVDERIDEATENIATVADALEREREKRYPGVP